MPVYQLADIPINIKTRDWSLNPNYQDFRCDMIRNTHTWGVHFNDTIPAFNMTEPYVASPRKNYYEGQFETSIHYPHADSVMSLVTFDSQMRNCSFYIKKKYDAPQNSEDVQLVRDRLQAAVTEVTTATLAVHQGLQIHSSAIAWEKRGIIFAAPSGTGKSTHVHLWQEQYDIRILDGDVSACRVLNGAPTVYGLPWCGTSGEFCNDRAPLNAIVFLEQSAENNIIRLEKAEAMMRLISNSFLPFWSERLMTHVLDTAQSLVNLVDCYLLQCRPDSQSVKLIAHRLSA